MRCATTTVQNTSRHTALRELVAALARAQRALAAGHHDDARAALNHALDIDPGNVQARDLLLRLDAGSGGGPSTERSWPPEAAEDGPDRAAANEPATGWAAFEARVRARRAALESGAGARVRERNDAGLQPAVISWPPATRSVSPPAFDEERSQPTASPTPLPITTIEPPRVRAGETRESRQADMAPSSDQMAEGASVPPEIAWDAMTPASSGEPLPVSAPTFGASSYQAEDRQRSRRLAVPMLLVAVATIVAAAIGGVWVISQQEEPISPTSAEQAADERPTAGVGGAPAETPAAEPPTNVETTDPAATSIPGSAGEAPQAELEPVDAPSESVGNEERIPQVPDESRPQRPPADPGARDNVQPERADSAASLETQPAPSAPALPEPAAPVSTMAGRRPAANAGAPGGALEPAPSVPAATSPIASGTPSPSTPVPPPPAPAEPSRAAVTPPRGPDPVMGIRRALDDYARAYSERDAVAASQIWPAVDARALARAFDQLSEQSVSFSKCDIRPEGGDRAQASCTGRATWVPKVGDRRPRAEARTWRFALTRDGDEWVIEQVRF